MALTDLWAGLDRQGLGGIVALSLAVSVTAAILAGVFGAALGAALAVYRVPGRRIIVVALHALLGLPPVVVGLALYLLLSRAGPLGGLGLLFTPAAMVLAQGMLALPIVAALVHAATADLWAEYGPAFEVDGATPLRATPHLLTMAPHPARHRIPRRLWENDFRSWRHPDRRRQHRRLHPHNDDGDRA